MTGTQQQWPGQVIRGAPAQPPAPTPLPGAGTGLPERPGELWPGTVVAAPRADDAGARAVGQPITYDRSRLPSNMGLARASLPTDTDQRIRVMAADLFPGMDIGMAARRFGLSNGRLFYVAQDNKPYWAEPQVTANPQDLVASSATLAGPAMSFIGGAAGGVGSGPMSILGAAGGAAAGDAARQFAAQAVVPEGPPGTTQPEYDPWQTASEAATAAGGQAVGLGVGRLLTHNPAGVGALDRSNARVVARSGAADAAQAEAQAQGVPLSFGQATNLRSAREAERALASDPVTADAMQAFYEKQRTSLRAAVLREADALAPGRTADEAAGNFREAAGQVGNTVRRQANATARPFYQAAEPQAVDISALSPDVQPIVAQAIKTVRGDAIEGIPLRGAADDSVLVLDATRKHLDDLIQEARQAGRGNRARLLQGARDELDAALKTNPDYAQALAAAQPGQAAAARIEASATARAGDSATDAPARQITAPMFDFKRISPAGIAQARTDFTQAGKLDEWNQGLRAYIESTLDTASRGTDGGASATRLRAEIWADPRARAAMKAAMDGPQFASFERLMQVVEHVARTLPENSATANKLMSSEMVERMSQGTGARAIQLAGRLFSPLRLADTAGAAADRLSWGLTQKGKEALAAAMTDPANLEGLRRLRMLSPTSQAAMDIASQLLLRSGLAAVHPLFGVPADRPANPE